MNSLLPDDYTASGFDEFATFESAEIGYDDCHAPSPLIMDGDIYQGLAAWNQEVPGQHHLLQGYQPSPTDYLPPTAYPTSADLGPVAGLNHSAPAYYHAPYVSQQPSPHYLSQQHALSQSFQLPRQAPVDPYDSYSECGSEVSSSCGSYTSSMGAPNDRILVDTSGNRVRVRNTSAPPTPLGAPPHFPRSHQGPSTPTNPSRPNWGSYPLSASYGDHLGSSSFPDLPMMDEPFYKKPMSSPRQTSRRRPAAVPVLTFGALSLNHSGNVGLSPYSPASLPPMSPHSPHSQASFSDGDSPRSNGSTPRSTTSTPRSTTSTPRSVASGNEKKRSRSGAPHPLERERRVRPKVVAEKGALQCKGVNRKKNSRCRNAALMEYIGPRPLYCAEHITLDPDSYYSKCASSYHKVSGDGKGCREVVLKELEFCHKHYSQTIDMMLNGTEEGYQKSRGQFERISFLLAQLEAEAMAAKRTDPDLFQRKHKLIPKYMEMKKTIHKRLVEYEPSIKLDDPTLTGSILSSSFGHNNELKFLDENSQDTPKDSSTTTTPSDSSADDACNYEEPSQMMQVEERNFPIF